MTLLPNLWWTLQHDAELKLRNLSLMFCFELLYFTAVLLCVVFELGYSLLWLFVQMYVEVRETLTHLIQNLHQCSLLTLCIPLPLLRFVKLRCEARTLLHGIFQLHL